MATKLPIRVTYGPYEAGFNCRANAFEFARYISRMSGHASEIRDVSGLIMQYNDLGEPSPEFAPVDPMFGPGSDAGGPVSVGNGFKIPTLEVFTNTLIAGGIIQAVETGAPMRGVVARLDRSSPAGKYVENAYHALTAAMVAGRAGQELRSHIEGVERIASAHPTRAARDAKTEGAKTVSGLGFKAEAPRDPTGPGRTVHKFRLLVGERDAYIRGEGLTRIVHFGLQDGKPHCWAEVHPGEPMCERRVIITGTGHPVPAGMVHQGALFDQAFVWHLYAGPVL